ncbi:ClpXP adapter SpxH family protein [Dyadobacter sp. LHD-138]|uniref:ClpXP adapter SpxH family protein n=1 Tax=Dyadobacter sp. LHD-138 TaxID=3071413 RepID=UPI0027DF7BF0|nr:ClpXP adapter SpxH family protein [Dyadobacter sp. LHD-138]MDQ6478200.1 ClpXP adapter SpxH family protein [Dyadobacter sp. LHD-138]
MENNINPLLCDPETGLCELPGASNTLAAHAPQEVADKVKIIYFTDPICSSCWGIEPQLRQLELEYGHAIEFDIRMGGLLPDWSYNSGGISKPSDVAHHWDEVSQHYDMPIDGDIWLEDPLDSSYPPSIAVKAAQFQDPKKAVVFLRKMREFLFLEKKNITRWEHLAAAAVYAGLDEQKLKLDYTGRARESFQKDLQLAAQLGVRGFPTMIFVGSNQRQTIIRGSQPYRVYEDAVMALGVGTVKKEYDRSVDGLFAEYPTQTVREFAELSGNTRVEALILLRTLVESGELAESQSKNGPLYHVEF